MADRRLRLYQLIDGSLGLEEPERSAYFRDACEGDEELRREVEEMLEGRGRARDFLAGTDDYPEAAAPVFAPNELIAARFRIVRFRGRGGMGEVYEAYDERLRTRIGLKTLRAGLMSDAGALDRFRREIQVAHEVTHPNVCRVYDLIEHRQAGDEVINCLTMEWLEGETLQALVDRARPLPLATAMPLILQIAAALDALHAAGIVHRDLKPGNIMLVLQPNGATRAVVTDFGLAKATGGGREWYDSQLDAQAGAPYFMAPEQLHSERPTAATDIYAFGLVIDEMVTASRAFNAGSLAALYYQRLWDKPTPPSERAMGLPPAWDHAIRQCLAAEPAERPASAGDVAYALDHEILLPEAAAPVAAAVPTSPGRRWTLKVLLALIPGIAILLAMNAVFSRVETSVKVFEFDGGDAGAEFQHLSRGTTAEVLRRLTALDGVRVIPVRSTRNKAAGGASGVQFQLDGSMAMKDGRARLTVNLTDNRDGSPVWSEVFEEKELADRVAFQSRIAEGVAAALEQHVLARRFAGGTRLPVAWFIRPVREMFGRALDSRVSQPPTADSTALDMYMRGSKLYEEASPASAEAAIGYYERALDRDPSFALAMAAAADAYIYLKNLDLEKAELYLERARGLAESAVRADPSLAEAHTSLAAVRQASWDWEGARQSYQEAFRLKPGFARAHRWYCGLLVQFGRFDEALAHGRKAMELDPYDRATPASYGLYLFLAGREREAAAVMEPMLANLESFSTRYTLAQVYARLGSITQGAESKEYFQKALAQIHMIEAAGGQSPERRQRTASLADQLYALVYLLAGDARAAEPYVARLREGFQMRRVSALTLACAYAAQNKFDEALGVLEQGVAYRDPALLYVKVVPFLEKLHGQPRFEALLHQLRL